MNRQEFIRKYAEKTNTKICLTEEFINNLENLVVELVKSGETINLHGFCEIGTREVKDRMGTNPQNSEPITIKGGNRIYIKPGTKLKSAAKQLNI